MSPAGGGERRHRRVVRLSEVDRRRAARGLPTSLQGRVDADDLAARSPQEREGVGEHANDERLLREVPPHWQAPRLR